MTKSFNWDKINKNKQSVKNRSTSIIDEQEFMEKDWAARWLAKHSKSSNKRKNKKEDSK